jgi:flagellar protein FliO/FliZ
MGFFESIFGTELGLPARAVVALVLVLALIALTVWLMRRFGDGRIVSQAGGRGRQQRLAVLDSATVDARRRLILIRRDNAEHLLLIGGPTDVVVEQNIVRGQALPGTARAPGRSAFEEDEASLVPLDETPVAAPPPAPAPRVPPPAPRTAAPEQPRAAAEPPRTMPQAPQRVDPQYADMAQRLEAALRKGAAEADAARAAPPVVPPRTPEPRAPEAPRPAQAAPAPRPAPRAPEPRIPEAPRAPEPRPAPAQPAPSSQQSAADVFGSLEEEMASLLRPGKKENK